MFHVKLPLKRCLDTAKTGENRLIYSVRVARFPSNWQQIFMRIFSNLHKDNMLMSPPVVCFHQTDLKADQNQCRMT